MASSSDEGEIIEDGTGDLKATSLATHSGNGIDRRDRLSSRQSSPEYDSASGRSGSSRPSRSPPPRGHKRTRDERDSIGRTRDRDSRQVRARYDDRRGNSFGRSRITYDDLDRPPSNASGALDRWYDKERDYRSDRRPRGGNHSRYPDDDDEMRYNDRKVRVRSPSPPPSKRHGRSEPRRFAREGYHNGRDSAKALPYDDDIRSGQKHDTASDRTTKAKHLPARPNTAKPSEVASNGVAAHRDHVKQLEPEAEADYEEPQQIDEEAEIARRRRRREELLAKSSSATPLLLHAVGAAAEKTVQAASPASTLPDTPNKSFEGETPRTPRSDVASPRSPGPSPDAIDILKDDKDLMNTHGDHESDDEDGPSAANYDPTADKREDERRDELRHGQSAPETTKETSPEAKSEKALARNEGDGNDDDFDMFAEDIDVDKYASKHTKAVESVDVDGPAADVDAKGGILEGDDKDGYYKIRIGEILSGRYQIQATLGRGMFSGVVRAIDITTKQVVAIKMMRNNDALRKGGYTEIAILQKLNAADPESRKHIVKFERHFDYRGHLCMAFENLSMNLREVLRKFGNNVGINLGATRTYAYQIFVALAHMRKCSIIHADLKPDNILVNEQRNVLKICDLGTAIDRSDAATAHNQITPYLVSRFYRAPEVILGMPYDYGVDMWSIGCTLYELYTGKILFAGDSNNQMLKAIMEIRGRLTPKLFRRGQLAAAHFDEQGRFVSVERDKVLGKTAIRTMAVVKPARDLRTRLHAASTGMNEAEAKHLNHFVDLLEQCLALNPDKRITPGEAMKHPFFTSKPSSAATATTTANGRR
ncbi:serine/threonine-protein kinase prp4 [Moelleriella libera RCEF 2490]|uniref:non-specific serine/threonine protein kinase n=1 Tax=Moelleriella libera RCEF 2490 TaxID=1081109 RepID=A0A168EIR9_9HYPO|nr:serine/threonine-protein kinase prp4 [Moelleriella libera RCEF 2490]